MKKALIIVDAQRDFMPGGSLAVPKGDEIVLVINELRKNPYYTMKVWTKDWHPADHCSFKDNGGIWPRHCVAMSSGAALHNHLRVKPGEYIVTKGMDPKFDSYSGFFDDGGKPTGLARLLKKNDIEEVDVCGLALEYCVKFTVLDALKVGLKVNVLTEGCRGLDSNDCDAALEEMKAAGAVIK